MIVEILAGAAGLQLIGGFWDAQKKQNAYAEILQKRKATSKPMLNIGSSEYLGDVNLYLSNPPVFPPDIQVPYRIVIVNDYADMSQFTPKQFGIVYCFGIISQIEQPQVAIQAWKQVADEVVIVPDSVFKPSTWFNFQNKWVKIGDSYTSINPVQNITLTIMGASVLSKFRSNGSKNEVIRNIALTSQEEEEIEEDEDMDGLDAGALLPMDEEEEEIEEVEEEIEEEPKPKPKPKKKPKPKPKKPAARGRDAKGRFVKGGSA
jgi:hypothetical protein